jgi:membrane-associated phospholipid phosphatase
MDDAPAIAAIPRKRFDHRWAALAAASFLLFLASVFADWPVAHWVRASGVQQAVLAHHRIKEIVKMPGVYWFTLVLAVLVGLFHRLHWRGAAFVALAGVIGLINTLLKWVIGRPRPYSLSRADGTAVLAPLRFFPFNGGPGGLMEERNLSFPSGHACIAFLTAAALAVLLPRWRWPLFAFATVVAIERVAENAHYVSDVVGAALLALWGVAAMRHWLTRPLLTIPVVP